VIDASDDRRLRAHLEHEPSTHTLVDVFNDSVAANPDAVALRDGERTFTYGDLSELAMTIAGLLAERGVHHGHRVALRMDPCAEAVAAILAVLGRGAAYVPLDVRTPRSRNLFILRDSGAHVLLGDEQHDDLVPAIPLTEVSGAHRRVHLDASLASPGVEELAYIIYTSGTTGQPKGVPITHGNVTALLDATADLFTFDPADRWLLFHSLAFDFSVWEIWGALAHGGALVLLPFWAARDPDVYLDLMMREEVTVLNHTPTAFAALCSTVLRRHATVDSLRYVIFGGERLSSQTLRPWVHRFGLQRPRLVNMYGITEVCVHATFHELTMGDLEGDHPLIGRVLPGFSKRVVDDQGRDVAPGQLGELWLGGPQVTAGYLDRDDLNTERFVVLDGAPGTSRLYKSGDLVETVAGDALAYHGRKDLQVKLRGYRIELIEVEDAVRAHPLVADAVADIQELAAADTRLICAYSTHDGTPVSAGVLRAHVRQVLPSYMLPARYVHLGCIPRTTNGKVDRVAVAHMCRSAEP
jgi:amino acid adenylation domain-containing protein